jgi:hypothetical protein
MGLFDRKKKKDEEAGTPDPGTTAPTLQGSGLPPTPLEAAAAHLQAAD